MPSRCPGHALGSAPYDHPPTCRPDGISYHRNVDDESSNRRRDESGVNIAAPIAHFADRMGFPVFTFRTAKGAGGGGFGGLNMFTAWTVYRPFGDARTSGYQECDELISGSGRVSVARLSTSHTSNSRPSLASRSATRPPPSVSGRTSSASVPRRNSAPGDPVFASKLRNTVSFPLGTAPTWTRYRVSAFVETCPHRRAPPSIVHSAVNSGAGPRSGGTPIGPA